jgi:hypothetical protein
MIGKKSYDNYKCNSHIWEGNGSDLEAKAASELVDRLQRFLDW